MTSNFRISLCSLVVLISAAAPRMMMASTTDTLLVKPSSGSPYEFSINGSSIDTSLSCLNNERTIGVGESWTATVENLETMITDAGMKNNPDPTDGVLSITDLEKDAYLYTLYGSNTTTNQEVQDAIWSVLDGYTVTTDLYGSTEDNAVSADLTAAASFIKSTSATASFYSEFTFYAPVAGTQSAGYGSPQEFLGYTPPPAPSLTPEPSSLLLLGTGIIGLAGALRLRSRHTV